MLEKGPNRGLTGRSLCGWCDGAYVVVDQIHKHLHQNVCKHCAALFIVGSRVGSRSIQIDRNGTVTFIEYGGRTYGVTCEHVVKALERMPGGCGEPFRYALAVIVKNAYRMLDGFVSPPGDIPFLGRGPDIALLQIDPDLVERFGKTPISLTGENTRSLKQIGQAVAVGYPERRRRTGNGPRPSCSETPCAFAVARNVSVAGSRFRLFSELKRAPEMESLSGMSGGPVFWTTQEDYGLLGITYGALPLRHPRGGTGQPLGGGPRMSIAGELVTPERFGSWVGHLRG
jgi:hypothetical protein